MSEKLPEYLKQGEVARLFPVLSTTSKEGRTTSIVLACMTMVEDLGKVLLQSIKRKVGVRTSVVTYTEVVFKSETKDIKDRPDGLIVLKIGSKEWRALVESKVGNNKLDEHQIERYRELAKNHSIDCVITISNQFSTNPINHPLESISKSRSKIPVYHWSWMHILTSADLLINQGSVSDPNQLIVLNELRRFLSHESAGVKGFERMPKDWVELNKLVSSGGAIPAKSKVAVTVLDAWHQETRDLSLILSRLVETNVSEKLPRRHVNKPAARQKDELDDLRGNHRLTSLLDIPDAASVMEITADLNRRCIDVGMTLRAPEDKVSTTARMNWLLRQIKHQEIEDIHVRLMWPGKSEPTQFPMLELKENVNIAKEGKEHLAVSSFHIFVSKRIGVRFTQQANFISDLESIVPNFYRDIGSNLTAWNRTSPKIKEKKSSALDVSTTAISDEADDFQVLER